MASVFVTICFRELLRDVCQHFSLEMPKYGVPVENEGGLVCVFVDMDITRADNVIESVGCWSNPCANIDRAEEDAARRLIGKLCSEFSFEVRDFNLENKKFYENLYERLSGDHGMLGKKYKRLKNDYNLLRGYYNDLLAEKESCVVQIKKLKENIDRCVVLLEHAPAVVTDDDSGSKKIGDGPDVTPGYDAAVPPGYET